MLNTPVAFFIYKRPEFTKLSFESIAVAKPRSLFVIADGPKTSEEYKLVEASKSIIKKIDWDCKINTNFSDKHMGCGIRVITGLEWLFSHVDEAIILEDDCIASEDFFRFCEEMLCYHRDNEQVFSINGCNIGFKDKSVKDSYTYSTFMNMWGWATWKRTFNKIDFSIKCWDEYKGSDHFKQTLGYDNLWIKYWIDVFNIQRAGGCDTWDYSWILSQLYQKGLSVVPSFNMIKNIGCGEDATHTQWQTKEIYNLKTQKMLFPLIHPKTDKFCVNRKYEHYIKYAWCGFSISFSQRCLAFAGKILFKLTTSLKRIVEK